jgi:hypothetical protein
MGFEDDYWFAILWFWGQRFCSYRLRFTGFDFGLSALDEGFWVQGLASRGKGFQVYDSNFGFRV